MTRIDRSRFGKAFEELDEDEASEGLLVEGTSVGGVLGEDDDFEKSAASRLLVFVREAAAITEGAALAVRGRESVDVGETISK